MRTRKSPHSTPAPLPVPMNNGQGAPSPMYVCNLAVTMEYSQSIG